MKFIDKLFSGEQVAWKEWLLRDAGSFDTPPAGTCSYLWKIITDELNTYRSITTVDVHDGASTSFWFDNWLSDGPLCSHYAALFSHTTKPNISVQCVFQNGFDLCLRPRLTTAASFQLDSLMCSLQDYSLREGADSRTLKTTGKPYTTRDAYAALDCNQGSGDEHGRRIWKTRVPNKVKVFAWLYFKDRLSTRANLHSKNVVENELCQRCSAPMEDRDHVFFVCTASADFWCRIGLSDPATLSDEDVWNSPTPNGLEARLWPFVFLTMLWRLWDARNGEIFRNELSSSRAVIFRICDDLVVWRKRLKTDLASSLDDWRAYLLACNATGHPGLSG
jgi:hypothetical protein